MRRAARLLALSLVALPAVAVRAFAEPPAAPAAPAVKPLAADAEAEAALAKFKEDFKAKGLKGDDKLSQKDFALQQLSKLQHPKVVEALASASRDSDATVRMLGIIYLGDQQALPGAAGKRVVEALSRGSVEDAFRMTCLQQIGRLKYLGAREPIRDGLKAPSYAVKKSALATAGRTGDLRLLGDVVAVIGVDLPVDGTAGGSDPQSSGKEVTQEGASWEGAEASVDTGTAGDSDQKAAEAQAKAQAAANQAAAQKGGGGPGGGDGGGARGAGGASRSPKELVPTVLGVLKQLTGRTFANAGEFKRWYAENRKDIVEKTKALDEAEKAQKAAAK